MTFKDFIEKVKNDKKILIPIVVLVALVFTLIFYIISLFGNENTIQTSQNIDESSLIPEDSILLVEKHTKLSSYEENKSQNINKGAELNSMIDGLIDQQDTTTLLDTTSNIISEKENADVVNERTLSFKEKLLAKQNQYNRRHSAPSSSGPKTYQPYEKTTNYKASKTEKKEVVKIKEEVVEPKRRTKDITKNYGSLFNGESESNQPNHIPSVIHNEGRKVKAGSYVKIRLSEDMKLKNDVIIPKNTIITAICSFGNQRVYLRVENILYNGKRHSVKLEAYALDGYRGLYDENVIDKEIAQSAMDDAISSGSKDVNLPVIGTISLDILKKKIKEQHTILRELEHMNLEFSKH